MQPCTDMSQALPAALLPRPGYSCGRSGELMTGRRAASRVKEGKQILYRHLVNLWELLQSYLNGTRPNVKQRAYSDTCFPSKTLAARRAQNMWDGFKYSLCF